jgi:hypothetical protein
MHEIVMKVMNKKGQQTVGMPFSMIFALFLIVVFIVVAFIGVRFFLDFGRTADVGLFYDKLQRAVDDALAGQGSDDFEINLPEEVKRICFANLSAEITAEGEDYDQIKQHEFKPLNIFLIPPGSAEGMKYQLIENIDIAKITQEANPYCVDADDELIIKRDFYDKLVVIS